MPMCCSSRRCSTSISATGGSSTAPSRPAIATPWSASKSCRSSPTASEARPWSAAERFSILSYRYFLAILSAPGVHQRPKGQEERFRMLYAILCYNEEDVVWSWSKEEDAAVMARLGAVQDRLTKAGKLGPSLRLLPTTSATTLRKTHEPPLVIDGPFAETKRALPGL